MNLHNWTQQHFLRNEINPLKAFIYTVISTSSATKIISQKSLVRNEMKLTWLFAFVFPVSLRGFGKTALFKGAPLKSLFGGSTDRQASDSIFAGEAGHLLFFEFLEWVIKGEVGITNEDFLGYFDWLSGLKLQQYSGQTLTGT